MKPLGEINRVHLSEQQKLLFLQSILSHKEILFGRHDLKKGITNEAKNQAWAKIHDAGITAGWPLSDVNHTRRVRTTNFV